MYLYFLNYTYTATYTIDLVLYSFTPGKRYIEVVLGHMVGGLA